MINFIIWLQQFESPALNSFFLAATHITNEVVFLLVLGYIYWCVNKEKGYTMCIAMIASFSVNTALKNIFDVPRPYVVSDKVRQLDLETGYGYSFPSGHSQLSATMGGLISYVFRRRAVAVAMCIFVLITGLSRMYLGVHTLVDVIAGYGVGALVAFLGIYILKRPSIRHIGAVIIVALSHLVLFLTKEHDLIKILGASAGFVIGGLVEEQFICFKIKRKKLFRAVCGFLTVILIKFIMSLLNINGYLEYAVVGFSITAIAPMVFTKAEKYFKKR